MEMKSWRPEFVTSLVRALPGDWITNSLRFRTQAEARQYAGDLASRWVAVTEWRAWPSEDTPTHQLVDGELTDLPK